MTLGAPPTLDDRVDDASEVVQEGFLGQEVFGIRLAAGIAVLHAPEHGAHGLIKEVIGDLEV